MADIDAELKLTTKKKRQQVKKVIELEEDIPLEETAAGKLSNIYIKPKKEQPKADWDFSQLQK